MSDVVIPEIPIAEVMGEIVDTYKEDEEKQSELIKKLIETIKDKEVLKESLEKFCKENDIKVPESVKKLPEVIPNGFLKKIMYYLKKIWESIKKLFKKLFK